MITLNERYANKKYKLISCTTTDTSSHMLSMQQHNMQTSANINISVINISSHYTQKSRALKCSNNSANPNNLSLLLIDCPYASINKLTSCN